MNEARLHMQPGLFCIVEAKEKAGIAPGLFHSDPET